MLSCGVAAKSSFTNVLVAHVQVDEPDFSEQKTHD